MRLEGKPPCHCSAFGSFESTDSWAAGPRFPYIPLGVNALFPQVLALLLEDDPSFLQASFSQGLPQFRAPPYPVMGHYHGGPNLVTD